MPFLFLVASATFSRSALTILRLLINIFLSLEHKECMFILGAVPTAVEHCVNIFGVRGSHRPVVKIL